MTTGTEKDKHRKIIGSIFVIFGSLMILTSLFAYNLLEFIFSLDLTEHVDHWEFGIISIHNPFRFFYIVPLLTTIWGTLQLSAGLGLLKQQEWSEKLSLVLAFFMIFNVPLGTAFSIYIFYAFLQGRQTAQQPQHSKTS